MHSKHTKDIKIVYYGCSVHVLDLLGEDIYIPTLIEHIIFSYKIFCNKHLPAALYKQINCNRLKDF